MNREIKFRAWDTERRMFVPQGEVIFKDYGETYFEVVPNCLEYVGDKVHNGEQQYNRFELMQFTGLKDKNGTEIYEGDVVKNPVEEYNGRYPEVVGHELYKIVWSDTDYMILGECLQSISKNHLQLNDLLGCEVIGNIYQNPELLKP